MMETVTFQEHDGALAAILPKEMANRLNVAPGDKAYAVETPNGILLIADPHLVRVLEAEHRISSQFQNALRELGS